MKINTLLLLISFVVLGFSISRVPTPYCNPKPTFHTAPISPGELETHDMANSISGYNLKITV